MPRRTRGVVSQSLVCGIAVTAAVLFSARDLAAQEEVQISLPAIVAFNVPDVGASTQGSPNPTTIAFSRSVLFSVRALRMSVKAEGNFTGPGGSIAASLVSWETSNVLNGVASNGTLSAGGYTQVYEGQAGSTSGGADVVWTLSAPGIPLHAGVYQVALRWKLEAILP